MSDLKLIVAKNIAELRTSNRMTQLDLAEKLSYSDKAVSKWERGDSLPDITVLKEIADMFNVTVDYLLEENHTGKFIKKDVNESINSARAIITGLSILLVWFLATLAFVVLLIVVPKFDWSWLAFIYALPATAIVWLIFNTIWFNKRVNYFIISFLGWTTLCSIHLSLLSVSYNTWMVYLLGIPAQIIIIVWSRFKKKKVAKD